MSRRWLVLCRNNVNHIYNLKLSFGLSHHERLPRSLLLGGLLFPLPWALLGIMELHLVLLVVGVEALALPPPLVAVPGIIDLSLLV